MTVSSYRRIDRQGRFNPDVVNPAAAKIVFVGKPLHAAPFAALVIIAQLTGEANGMTAFWATSFFWLRLAHTIVYLFGIAYIRTLSFTLDCVAVAVLSENSSSRCLGAR